jgi:hypothetical protein
MSQPMAQLLAESVDFSILTQNHCHVLAASHSLSLVRTTKALDLPHRTYFFKILLLKLSINYFHFLPACDIFI